MTSPEPIPLRELQACFEGAIPAVIATSSEDGTPNVTYLSRVTYVDDERVALSNQFFSKTSRNLVENPRASLIVVDPLTHDQYRLSLVYERTDRRGPVFERLRRDLDITAELQHMQSVFRLRGADVYRTVEVQRIIADAHRRGLPAPDPGRRDGLEPTRIAELSGRLDRCGDLGAVVECALDGLTTQFGFPHVVLFLHDPVDDGLFAIASRGYGHEGVGAELALGEGLPGVVAQQCTPVRVGNLRQVAKYAEAVRRSMDGADVDDRAIPLPALPRVQSQLAVPVMALGALEGVLLAEETELVAFGPADEAVLRVVASVLGAAIQADRARERQADPPPTPAPAAGTPTPITGTVSHVRCYDVDGSVFIDGDYLIKGVAGRILAHLLRAHRADGRCHFTNREVRLDPALGLPSFRDNFDSRLILLKRRLDERGAPLRIEKTGRGRFRLVLHSAVDLEEVPAGP